MGIQRNEYQELLLTYTRVGAPLLPSGGGSDHGGVSSIYTNHFRDADQQHIEYEGYI